MGRSVFQRSEIVAPVHLHKEDLTIMYRILAADGDVDLKCDDIAYATLAELVSEQQVVGTLRMSLTPKRGKNPMLVITLDNVRSAGHVVWAENNRAADLAAGKVLRHLRQPTTCKGSTTTGLPGAVSLGALLFGAWILSSSLLSPARYFALAAAVLIAVAWITMSHHVFIMPLKPGIHLSSRTQCRVVPQRLVHIAVKISVPGITGVALEVLRRILQLN